MSIIRNSTSRTDHTVSIVRFGLIPGTSFYARQYARLTNKYFQLLQYESNGADYHDTVMVLADIPQDAEGYFYGVSDPDHTVWEMSIHKQGSKVYWKIGSVEEDHDWEPGVHCYGFVEGKPLYDGQWLGITACTTFVVNLRPFVGARNNAGGLAEGDVITSIDIYQVLLRAHQTSESTTGTLMTYYPVTDGTTGTVAKLFETRTLNGNLPLDSISGPTQQGVTPSSTPGEQVTYGVQLEDLRYITGSGYHDLMAILADDGGVDAALGWTATAGLPNSAADPYVVKSKNFALSLYQVHVVDVTGGTGGATGELMLGRKPKWSIWNDTFKNRGFWIYDIRQDGGGSSAPTVSMSLRYNFFQNKMMMSTSLGTLEHIVRLEDYEGISTQTSHIAIPQYKSDVPSQLKMQVCNGIFIRSINQKKDPAPGPTGKIYTRYIPVLVTDGRVNRSRLWPRFYNGEDMRGSDDDRYSYVSYRTALEAVYVNDGHEFDLPPITVAMGNIIDWSDDGSRHGSASGGWMGFFGVGLSLYKGDKTPGNRIERGDEYMRGVVTESTYLGASTSAAVKQAYKTDGKAITLSFLSGMADELAKSLITQSTVNCLLDMGLALNNNVQDSHLLVHTDHLFAPRSVDIVRDGDPVTAYRCVLMTPTVEISNGTNTSICNVVFGQVDHVNMHMHTRLPRVQTVSGVDFLFPFFLHYTDEYQRDRLVSAGSVSDFPAGADMYFGNGFGTNRKVVMCIQASYMSGGSVQRLRYRSDCCFAAYKKTDGTLDNDFYGNYTKYGAHDEIDVNVNNHSSGSIQGGGSYNRGTFIGDLTLYQEFTETFSSGWIYDDVSLTSIEGITSPSTNWQRIYLYYFIGHMYMDNTEHTAIPENSTVQVWLYQDNKVPAEWNDAPNLNSQ